MPQIIVTADAPTTDGEAPVMLRERVTVSDFESDHFAGHLVERLGWAVGDADTHDRRASHAAPPRREMRTRRPGQRSSARLVTTAS